MTPRRCLSRFQAPFPAVATQHWKRKRMKDIEVICPPCPPSLCTSRRTPVFPQYQGFATSSSVSMWPFESERRNRAQMRGRRRRAARPLVFQLRRRAHPRIGRESLSEECVSPFEALTDFQLLSFGRLPQLPGFLRAPLLDSATGARHSR